MTRIALYLLEVRHRALGLGVIAVTVCLALCALRVRFDDVPSELFRSDDETFVLLERVQETFHTDENDVVVVLRSGDFFTSERIEALRRLTIDLARLPDVIRVVSLAQVVVFDETGAPSALFPPSGSPPDAYASARRRAIDHPLVGSRLISPDGETLLLLARLPARGLGIEEIRPTLEAIEQRTAELMDPVGVDVMFTGIPAIRVSLVTTLRKDQAVFLVAGCLLSAAIAFALFRSFFALVVASAGPLTGLVWSLGLFGVVYPKIDLISSVLPSIVLLIGFSDSVHLVLHFRGLASKGVSAGGGRVGQRPPPHAGLRSHVADDGHRVRVARCRGSSQHSPLRTDGGARLGRGVPCGDHGGSLASPRVAGAAHARLGTARRAGRACARSFRLAPASLSSSHRARRLCRNRRPGRRVASARARQPAHRGAPGGSRALPGARALRAGVRRNPRGASSRRMGRRTDDRGAARGTQTRRSALSTSHPSRRRQSLWAQWFRACPPRVAAPAAFEALLTVLPSSLTERFIDRSRREALVSARVPNRWSSELEPEFQRIEDSLSILERETPGFRFQLTGTVVVISRKVSSMIRELAISFGVAAVVIFVVMSLSFRSIRLGLFSLPPNVFPLVVAASSLVFTGEPLLLSFSIVFSMALGIAVDDTIHCVARYQREVEAGASSALAARATLRAVGAALIVTTGVFVGGFLSITLSEVEVLRTFGCLGAGAIASALIGDLVILPALLAAWGRPSDARTHSPDA